MYSFVKIASAFLVASLAIGPQSDNKSSFGQISGVVLDKSNNYPVESADLQLESVDTKSGERVRIFAAKSDPAGKFTFNRVPPGLFKLSAANKAFPRQEFGEVITVDLQQTRVITFFLTAGTSLEGRVTDSTGKPIEGMKVEVLSISFDEFRSLVLSTQSYSESNELGLYKVFNLPSGKYLVRASDPIVPIPLDGSRPERADGSATKKAHQPQYYFNAVDFQSARTVKIEQDRPQAGIDFIVRDRPAYSVRGNVVDLRKSGESERRPVILDLYPRTIPVGYGFGHQVLKPDGSFEFSNIYPGEYWVSARLPISSGVTRPQFSIFPINVTNSNLENIRLEFPDISLSGSVKSEAALAVEGLGGIGIELRSVSGLPSGQTRKVITKNDGTFKFEDLNPDEYRMRVIADDKFYVKEIQMGPQSLLKDPIAITTSTSDSIGVLINWRPGSLSGIAVNENGGSFPNALIVLVPKQRDLWYLYKHSISDAVGRFAFQGISPGDYELYAWDRLNGFAYFDEELLNASSSKMQSVVISEMEESKIQLHVSTLRK